MIIKPIIFIFIAYLIQLSSEQWYSILFFSMIIGFGSNSYRQSVYLGALIGATPWLFEFIIKYSISKLLLQKIAIMLKIYNPIILVILSILFISIVSIMVSVSMYHCKKILYVKK